VLGIDSAARERLLAALATDWRQAELSEVDRALCDLAERMTREPASLREADVRALRAIGLADEAIHHAVQVVAYFNYINRVADALGVDLEPGMPPRPEA
jgi:uncharacterized peroxidase-related enzyme